MRRVIIFFTSPYTNEWTGRWNFESSWLYAVRVEGKLNVTGGDTCELPEEFERVVIWVNGQRLRDDVRNQNSTLGDAEIPAHLGDRAREIFGQVRNSAGEAEILVASHGWTNLPITGAMSVVYHTRLDGYGNILLPLAAVDQSEFANQFDEAWRYLLSAPRLPKLKYLSHRIEHIFAPLAVDIQGILQVEPHRRLEYAQKIIESYRTRGDHPFLTLFADLYFLLCGRETLQFRGTTLRTCLSKEYLPEVRQLDGNSKRMALCEILGVQHDIDCAKRIREICGLDNSWSPKDDSWLIKFLNDLEEAIAKNDPAKLVDVITKGGKEFLAKCQALHRCFDELETLLPEYAEPAEEGR